MQIRLQNLYTFDLNLADRCISNTNHSYIRPTLTLELAPQGNLNFKESSTIHGISC
jgi:hypothetical protein